MDKRLHVLFSGRVQGVGFRFTAENIARHFEVTGYVRNLSNGEVEITVEGEEQVLRDFLKAVSDAMKGCIRDIRTEWSGASGKFKAFGIAY